MRKTKAKPYQDDGVHMLREFIDVQQVGALLADEMGLGKSFQALKYFDEHVPKDAGHLVIVCPATLKINWSREALHHFGLTSEILSGRKPPKRSKLLGVHKHARILIINYEILHNWLEYLGHLKIAMVVWDEGHYVQNRETVRFQALNSLLVDNDVVRRLALTGTPLTNRPAELWATLHLLLPQKFKSFVEYGFKYCKPKIVRGKWEFRGARNLGKLHTRLRKLCMIRRLKKDVLKDLPKKVRKMVPVELSADAWAEYQYCTTDFLRWMKERHPAKLHRARKALQLTRLGYQLRLLAKLKRHAVLEWIESFLRESDGKLVVFTGHTKLIEWLQKRFSKICVVINGGVTGEKRQHAVDSLQNDPRIRLAFCNPKAAGVGLTLTSANYVLYADFPYSPATLKQGEDRIHRIGQTLTCFIYFMAAIGTVEEKLCNLLIEKQDILDAVLDGKSDGGDLDIFQELFDAVLPAKIKGRIIR